MKLNNNDDSHNSGLNLLIYNMLLDIESHPTWVCGLKQFRQFVIDPAGAFQILNFHVVPPSLYMSSNNVQTNRQMLR